MEHWFGTGRLVPFAAAVQGAVVGTHDGIHITVQRGALNDRVVVQHEHGHELLFSRTLDGALLALLWRLIDDRPAPLLPERLAALATTARTLAAHSRFAHEVFATYFGVKSVEPAAVPVEQAKLPPAYRRYYDTAARVLDPHFGSTFLQCCVAMAVAYVALNSRFATRFFAHPWQPWTVLHRDEQPNRRLKALLRHLADGGAAELRRQIDAWAAGFFAAKGLSFWDIHSEAGWQSAGAEGVALDSLLSAHVAGWLAGRGVVPYRSIAEREADYEQLNRFAEGSGVELQVVLSKPEPNDDAVGQRALASFIANHPLDIAFDSIRLDDLWQQPAYRQARELAVYGPDPALAHAPWTIVRLGPPGTATNFKWMGFDLHAAHIGESDAIAWLAEVHAGLGRWQGPVPSIVVTAFEEGAFGRLANALAQASTTEAEALLVPWESAVYVQGNWLDFLQKAASLGHVETFMMRMNLRFETAAPQQVSVAVARCEAISGPFFFRVFESFAGAQVRVLALKWPASGPLRLLSSVDEARDRRLVPQDLPRAIDGLLAFWTRW